MSGSDDAELKKELKELILKECQRDLTPEEIPDDAPIVGPDSTLELDSLDILQVSVALQNQYGVRLEDSKESRRVFVSINSLADFIKPD